MTALRLLLAAFACVACATPRNAETAAGPSGALAPAASSPSSPPPSSDSPATLSSPSRPSPARAGTDATVAAGTAGRAPADERPALRVTFERVLEHPVSAIAVDKPPHVAALGETSVFVRTKDGFREQPLPEALRKAADAKLELFYGRDYRVRLVGSVNGDRGIESVYLRGLPRGLVPEPSELGQLGNSKASPLIAVLGTEDPEVVCRSGSVCLVKRLSGWTSLPAPAGVTHAAISRGDGFVLAGQRVFRAGREWAPIEPPGPFREPSGFSAVEERLYVLEAATDTIHVHVAGAWQSMRSPVGSPSSLWGAHASSVWLVGSGGTAHFDGKRFRRVEAPAGLVTVLGRGSDELWFAGKSGLYRVDPAQMPVDP